jgi:polyisoprenoid-binding protein YceI
MLHGSWWSFSIAAWLLAQAPIPTGSGPKVLNIDPTDSQVAIQVGKAGIFGFAGHAHEVAATDVHGQVIVDLADLSRASVSLEFAAAALRVTGKDEPPADVAEVQRVMLSDQVLDVKRFPTISFRSRRVSVAARTAAAADLLIEGDLTLHGTTRRMTVRVSAAFDAEGRLTVRGSCSLLQSDFGMLPVTAAGGTVRVRDEIDVRLVLRARPSDAPRTARSTAD